MLGSGQGPAPLRCGVKVRMEHQMNIVTKIVIASIFACLPSSVLAAGKQVGSWFVDAEKDPFGETTATAIVQAKGATAFLALRCLSDGYSAVLILSNGKDQCDTGDQITIDYRADEKPVQETSGTGFAEKMLMLENGKDVLVDTKSAKQLAFRLHLTKTNTVATFVFNLSQSAKALSAITADCNSSGSSAK